MKNEHTYALSLRWTGNLGPGTSGYRDYSRNHVIEAPGKPALEASSDPTFRGDPSRYNPEELLVAAISGCHMLWYLSLCGKAGIVVTAYIDAPTGLMITAPGGEGQFTNITLHPRVTITDAARKDEAQSIHKEAHRLCFIARSVNFPVTHEPSVDAPATA